MHTCRTRRSRQREWSDSLTLFATVVVCRSERASSRWPAAVRFRSSLSEKNVPRSSLHRGSHESVQRGHARSLRYHQCAECRNLEEACKAAKRVSNRLLSPPPHAATHHVATFAAKKVSLSPAICWTLPLGHPHSPEPVSHTGRNGPAQSFLLIVQPTGTHSPAAPAPVSRVLSGRSSPLISQPHSPEVVHAGLSASGQSKSVKHWRTPVPAGPSPTVALRVRVGADIVAVRAAALVVVEVADRPGWVLAASVINAPAARALRAVGTVTRGLVGGAVAVAVRAPANL